MACQHGIGKISGKHYQNNSKYKQFLGSAFHGLSPISALFNCKEISCESKPNPTKTLIDETDENRKIVTG